MKKLRLSILLLAMPALFAGCETAQVAATAQQKAQTNLALDRYSRKMIATIRSIDDRTSSAEIVARAAIDQNLSELQEVGLAIADQGSKMNHRAKSIFLSELPEQELPRATVMVLKLRQERQVKDARLKEYERIGRDYQATHEAPQ